MKEKTLQIKSFMDNYNETVEYHLYKNPIACAYLTDGVQAVADELGTYWLISIILNHQTREFREKAAERKETIQNWKLTVDTDKKGLLTMRFGNGPVEVVKNVEPYGFPLDELDLVFNSHDAVLSLAKEN